MSVAPGKRIAICGLVRDCRTAVEKHWHDLRELASDGHHLHWIFVENDSIDGSREWLENLAARHPEVRVIGENIGEATIPAQAEGNVMPGFSMRRISKMATFRNMYLDCVGRHIGFDNLDAVLVFDYDVVSLPVGRLREILRAPLEKKAFTALGILYKRFWAFEFYDCYAYREKGAIHAQSFAEINRQRTGLLKFASSRTPHEVDSNFNGCAVYPASVLENARYRPLPNDDPQVQCLSEHVAFNLHVSSEGVTVLLDPTLRVDYETPFSYWNAWLKRRFRKAKPTVPTKP